MTHTSQLPDSILRLNDEQIRAICRGYGHGRRLPKGVTILADEWGGTARWTIERTAVFQVSDDARIWAFTWQCAVGDGESEYPQAYEAFEVEAREVRSVYYARKG